MKESAREPTSLIHDFAAQQHENVFTRAYSYAASQLPISFDKDVELALRVEDEFGVKFTDEEAEELAGKTVGEFCAVVAERMPAAGTTVK